MPYFLELHLVGCLLSAHTTLCINLRQLGSVEHLNFSLPHFKTLELLIMPFADSDGFVADTEHLVSGPGSNIIQSIIDVPRKDSPKTYQKYQINQLLPQETAPRSFVGTAILLHLLDREGLQPH